MRTWSWHWSLSKTPALIVCSACIRFIAYRWSLLIRFNMEVVVGCQSHFCKTWLDMPRVYRPKGQSIWYLCRDCFSVLWNLLSSQLKQKKNDCYLYGGKKASASSHFSWSDLEPLSRKQRQAVWLTAQDNVKAMKTYTITVPFFLLSAHSVALWVTAVLCNKLQAFGLWNQHPLTANVCTIRWSDTKPTMVETLSVWFQIQAAFDTCLQADWMSISDL